LASFGFLGFVCDSLKNIYDAFRFFYFEPSDAPITVLAVIAAMAVIAVMAVVAVMAVIAVDLLWSLVPFVSWVSLAMHYCVDRSIVTKL
jgi:hypothetical protein